MIRGAGELFTILLTRHWMEGYRNTAQDKLRVVEAAAQTLAAAGSAPFDKPILDLFCSEMARFLDVEASWIKKTLLGSLAGRPGMQPSGPAPVGAAKLGPKSSVRPGDDVVPEEVLLEREDLYGLQIDLEGISREELVALSLVLQSKHLMQDLSEASRDWSKSGASKEDHPIAMILDHPDARKLLGIALRRYGQQPDAFATLTASLLGLLKDSRTLSTALQTAQGPRSDGWWSDQTRTLTFRARKGEATAYPVPYHVWTKRRGAPIPAASTWPEVQVMLDHEALAAQPLRGTTGPAARSPWMCTRPGALARIQRILAPPGHVPACHAHVGAYTGGLNGCYWLEVLERHADGTLLVENCADVGKKAVRRVRATIEADLVHPLLRGRQAARWTSAPAGEMLVVQDPRTMAGHAVAWLRARYPRTHAFLAAFEPELRARPLYRKFFAPADAPFYWMYGVRPETFARHKVVWMEIAAMIKASVLGGGQGGRIVVPDHKVILVAVDSQPEADYLAGVLNSAVVGAALRSYAVDNNVATNLLKNVVVPKFTPDDATQAAIARAARDARLAPDAEHLARAEADLAAAVEPLWG